MLIKSGLLMSSSILCSTDFFVCLFYQLIRKLGENLAHSVDLSGFPHNHVISHICEAIVIDTYIWTCYVFLVDLTRNYKVYV